MAALAMLPLPVSAKGFGAKDFVALSARLTGRPTADFDPETAARMLKAFQGRGLGRELARLYLHPASNDALAGQVVSAWYTGVCQTAAGPAVATFNDALLWKTAAFLHPPGTCGGPTDYWSRPPSA
ncbi:sugar dehydrogenase complex small subunit [Methylogaea oryzae]|nr:sugar dehydrogenase complex small subunit [Methylogaea oryzae]